MQEEGISDKKKSSLNASKHTMNGLLTELIKNGAYGEN